MIITVTGIDEVFAKLGKIEQIDKPVLDGILEALKVADDIVTAAYLSQGEGNGDFTTDIEEIPNGYVLIAEGEDVGFLEFGAGIYTMKDEFAQDVPFPVYSGSWSDEHGGVFNASNHQYWFYGGQRYEGIFPTRGMQEALDYLRNNLQGIIERKITEWIGN